MITKGKWNITNFARVTKTFASAESDDARAWMTNRSSETMVWDKALGEWVLDSKAIARIAKREERALRKLEIEQQKANKPKKAPKD